MRDAPPYLVRGADGRDYPADRDALLAWAAQRRLAMAQPVFDVQRRIWTTAAEIIGHEIFTGRVVLPPPHHTNRTTSLRASANAGLSALGRGILAAIILGIVTAAALLTGKDSAPSAVAPSPISNTGSQPDQKTEATSKSPPANQASIEAIATHGSRLYRNLIREYPNTGLYLTGGFPTEVAATLELAIPWAAWNSLASNERIALSYFIESQTSVVRRHPALYSLDPTGAPAWPQMENAFRSICSTCWAIVAGTYGPTGVSVEKTVLAGDQHWTRNNIRDPLIRASQFRESSIGEELPPLTWEVPQLDPTLRYQIPDASERLGYYEGDTFVYQTPADRAGAWR